MDSDERTRWCGPKTQPQSVIIDLGRPADLGMVVLTWETAFASGFSVDVSDDLRFWRTLHSTTSGDGGLDVLPVSGRGRYLRVARTERGTQVGYSLREVQAYARGALVPAQFGASVDAVIVLRQPGATASSTLTVTKATEVKWTASPPAGVTVKPGSGTLHFSARGQATAPLNVNGVNETGSATVPVSVTARSIGRTVRLAGADLVVTVPYGNLSDIFNNVSVTADQNTTPRAAPRPRLDRAGQHELPEQFRHGTHRAAHPALLPTDSDRPRQDRGRADSTGGVQVRSTRGPSTTHLRRLPGLMRPVFFALCALSATRRFSARLPAIDLGAGIGHPPFGLRTWSRCRNDGCA
ncbi:discoidin domain-containing protein [Actinomadura soli]|uniref:Discoidin domain-containing protein n=1 Tax=Actinomadura soli TaxID=2508997 RepID=A0A5C4JFT8_9ACTN|nr:discoidin domain-containing protein [Actinomadura soli]TMR02207.1 discoidin domain-containing protein [Actinomadura soli]